MVLGTEHPEFIEGFEAASANTVELFETMAPCTDMWKVVFLCYFCVYKIRCSYIRCT